MNNTNLKEYEKEFNEDSLWEKIKNFAKKAGCEVIEKVVLLYNVAKDPDTPLKAKSLIYGALGYFIMPLDAIPDITPVVGFSDDLTALATALTLVVMSIKPEHKTDAKEKIKNFGC
jgi:uncharacterized membrane protein YkvA (DUF1232 family)